MDSVFGRLRICHARKRGSAAAGGERRAHHRLLQEDGVDRSAHEGTFGLGRAPRRSLRSQWRITLDSRDQRVAGGRAALPTKPARFIAASSLRLSTLRKIEATASSLPLRR